MPPGGWRIKRKQGHPPRDDYVRHENLNQFLMICDETQFCHGDELGPGANNVHVACLANILDCLQKQKIHFVHVNRASRCLYCLCLHFHFNPF